ncbi:NUDIX domain-containing protein [Phytohabitans houttuyneae]|uniref:NUDIX hydrolase n=1 Tax=Phytohabitans houttuyneae TaxID=1076126 RepID=A0A6V8K2A2_9ACTN|nr:NUDIX hydrolase [Phytohabitans houttuyneae]GFJ76491.1 NUDIX hydrolase [Phytohabitans houttuyneae]
MTAAHTYEVRAQHERYRGPVFRVVTDEVLMPGGTVVERDYLQHVGAVGVVAVDGDGQVVLIRQYRHAVRNHIWEIPAGLADVPGEPAPEVAARELAEETDLAAGRLDHLLDLHTTPGCSNERIRLFLARDLRPAPASGFERHDEEAELQVRRFPLAEAMSMALAGEITNGPTVAGIFAAAHVLSAPTT